MAAADWEDQGIAIKMIRVITSFDAPRYVRGPRRIKIR